MVVSAKVSMLCAPEGGTGSLFLQEEEKMISGEALSEIRLKTIRFIFGSRGAFWGL